MTEIKVDSKNTLPNDRRAVILYEIHTGKIVQYDSRLDFVLYPW